MERTPARRPLSGSGRRKTDRNSENPNIRTIFACFAPLKPLKQESYGKAIQFRLRTLCDARGASRSRPQAGRRGRTGHGQRPCALLEIPRGSRRAPAQRQDSLRQQFRKRGLSRGTLRRTFAALLRPGQLPRRSGRDAGHRVGPLGAGVLSLRAVPAGDGRCRAAAGRLRRSIRPRGCCLSPSSSDTVHPGGAAGRASAS